MAKIDADSLLNDFKDEAGAHIEKIESAFLDADALASDPALMDGVFRAAHSIKGTASFFSLDKIVALAHALESVFSRIKNGTLTPGGDIADLALQSVDCLKDLLNNLRTPGAVDTDGLLKLLKSYSDSSPIPKAQTQKQAEGGQNGEKFSTPFDLNAPGIEEALKNAARRGHKAYYLNICFDRGLGRYYSQPKALIDDIVSIGAILEARIDGKAEDAARSDFADKVKAASSMDLLVTSVLEPELFLIAVELDGRFVHPIAKRDILGKEGPEQERTGQERAGQSGRQAEAQPQRRKDDFSAHSIRLDVSVVNGLMDLANEMILTRNQLLSSTSAYRKSIAGLTPILHDISRLTSEIQEKVMRTRMQPVSVIFGKFPRIIRDTAKLLNKDIHIEIMGGGVALDKYLLDALSDPITQLVKNSADHGVEDASRRAALGKPRTGVITLNAYMRDGFAIIEVSDDGAGIDTEALKRKALERGIAPESRLASMTNSAVFGLIFEPGLSTAKQVTNVSGRGVGMDIVKTNIEKLGGSIEIESQRDVGTTMRLKMPLTLSVVRTLIVTINSVQYAVPEANVERIVRVSASVPSKRFERINNSLALNLNGWILPAVTLDGVDAKAKGLKQPSPDEILNNIDIKNTGSTGRGQRHNAGTAKCLVLKTGGRHFALLIDDAVETEETLIKPLPAYLRNCRCYSSMTVLGSGSAIMILDAEGIMRFMGIEGVEKPGADELAEEGGAGKADENLRQVIIFKCSGAEYFALDADKISRIERIDPELIQEIGDGRFINVAGKTVQVIRPEDYAPVQKRGYDKSRLYLLTLNAGLGSGLESGAGAEFLPAGFLAGRVLDKAEDVFSIDGSRFGSDYVFGTGVYREKILIFLNSDGITRCERERLGR